MASKFQNRLVGTIILVAIGVIVLPDVLDGEKTHYKEEIASIPLKPELDSELESFATRFGRLYKSSRVLEVALRIIITCFFCQIPALGRPF